MRLLRRLARWFRHASSEADLAEEVAFHEAMKRRDLETSGLRPDEAAFAARRAMGHATLMREDARAVWIWPWLESVWQDAVYAFRSLRRQPAFSLVVVLTLASAIGLNTSLFTVFNALALRTFPVAEPERMVNLFSPFCCRREGGKPNGFSIAEVRYFAGESKTMSGFVLGRLTGEGRIEGEARTDWVSGNYFGVLGVTLQLGRGFAPDEDRLESPVPVAVLSWNYWQNQLGGDAAIVGKPVSIEGIRFTVIGVAPREFTGIEGSVVDAWIPLATVPLLRPGDRWMRNVLRQPDHCCISVAGRLAPGATRQAAEAELSALRSRFQPPGADPDQRRVTLTALTPLGAAPPSKRGPELPAFLLMLAGVAAVLALACANVANLLLARAAARQREIAVRLSLGASRRRVVRQLLTESLLLACLAGATGVLIAAWLPRRIAAFAMHNSTLDLSPDGRVLLFTLALSVLSCLLFGLAPSLHATRPPGTAGVRMPLRHAFLSVQVALCTVLLVTASVLVRGVQTVSRRDLGFDWRDVTTVSLTAPPLMMNAGRIQALVGGLLSGAGDGGAGPIGVTNFTPLVDTQHAVYRLPGQDVERVGEILEVAGDYFGVLGIPLLAGRDLASEDLATDAIVINEAMAKGTGGAAAAGRVIVVDSIPRTVVGVVRDANILDVNDVYPTVFRPFSGRTLPVVLARTGPGVVPALEATIARLAPRVRAEAVPLSEHLASRTRGTRFAAGLAGALGLLALLLAGVGMSGVYSYWVQQRQQEIGVRMALGARSAQVVRLVLASSGRALAVGLAIGIGGAVAATQAVRSMLYGLSPLDPPAFAAAIAVLLSVGVLATWLPVRRATRVDPVLALRSE